MRNEDHSPACFLTGQKQVQFIFSVSAEKSHLLHLKTIITRGLNLKSCIPEIQNNELNVSTRRQLRTDAETNGFTDKNTPSHMTESKELIRWKMSFIGTLDAKAVVKHKQLPVFTKTTNCYTTKNAATVIAQQSWQFHCVKHWNISNIRQSSLNYVLAKNIMAQLYALNLSAAGWI